MKVLSKEHRENLSRANKIAWARKNKNNTYPGESTRGDVIKVVKRLICADCETDKKVRCERLVREQARNGKLIQCFGEKFHLYVNTGSD